MKNVKKKIVKFSDSNIINFTIFFVFIFVIYLVFKLYQLQIIQGAKYNEIIKNRELGAYQRKINDKRGTIFFKNHTDNINTVAAVDIPVYDVYVNPQKVKDKNYTYTFLNDYKKINKEKYFKQVNKKNDTYEVLLKNISEKDVLKIKKEYKNKDLHFSKKNKRTYPLKENSSKIIGFVNHEYKGAYGLEKYYDNILFRDSDIYQKTVFSHFLKQENNLKAFSKKDISKEGDLYSSVDISVTEFANKILKKINKKYNAKYSGIIIMKPKTGQIIAMTDTENFNLNQNRKDYRNKFVEYRYEVGSVFKILAAAVGLESGAINKNFSYNDRGCVDIKEATFCNYDKKGRGKNTSLEKILIQSLNTGMIRIEQKVGHKVFFEKLLELGLAEETGIDLPNEVSSNISSLNDYNPINYAAASFGQSISFTPIGITRALSTIASDGYLVTPNVVSKIKYGGLIPDKEFSSEAKKVFSESTVKTIKDIMVKRSEKSQVKKNSDLEGYSVATKSGTAQIADKKKGGYLKGKNMHTFFGFFPAYGKTEDRFSIFIYTVEPRNVKYSSGSLTEPFFEIVNFLIKYYRVPPDKIRE
ncbi:hypothetical protein CSB11_00280 [Candidatus Campbellbacteria bacterium]|nr:MAG: hypothetical protein CSB11_00280 [Candidatus Campbellbacteria bacterium]